MKCFEMLLLLVIRLLLASKAKAMMALYTMEQTHAEAAAMVVIATRLLADTDVFERERLFSA